MRSITLLLSLLFILTEMAGQDPHFSQFYTNPILVNPALTGTSNGLFRVSSTYRDQWRSAIDEPLKTFTVSGDVSFEINARANPFPDKFAFGFNFFGDRVNQFDLNTTQISLFGAYHKALDRRKQSYLSAGIYVGVAQKNLNYEDLSFEDQFNAIDGYTLPSGEFLPANNFGYGDLGLGVNYTMLLGTNSHLFAGIGLFHFNQPNISFYKDEDINNDDLIRDNTLENKWSGYVALSMKQGEKMFIEPRILTLIQGSAREINLGTNFKYKLGREGNNYFHIGPWIRFSDNIDGFSVESLVAAVGIETGKFLIGLSYDQSISDLTSDRLGLNAFEVSLSYFGDFDNSQDFCPKF